MVTCGHRPEGLQTVTKAGPSKPSGPCAVTAGAAVNASPVTCGTSEPAGPLRFARLFGTSRSATRAVALQLADGDSRRLERRLVPPPSREVLQVGRPGRSTGTCRSPPALVSPLGTPLPRRPPHQGSPKGGNPSPHAALRADEARRLQHGAPGGLRAGQGPRPGPKGRTPCALEFANSEVTNGRPLKVPSAPAGGSHGAAREARRTPGRLRAASDAERCAPLGGEARPRTTLSLALARSRRAPVVGACRTSSTRKRRAPPNRKPRGAEVPVDSRTSRHGPARGLGFALGAAKSVLIASPSTNDESPCRARRRPARGPRRRAAHRAARASCPWARRHGRARRPSDGAGHARARGAPRSTLRVDARAQHHVDVIALEAENSRRGINSASAISRRASSRSTPRTASGNYDSRAAKRGGLKKVPLS